MREFRTPKEARLERFVRALSVFTFILLCWTFNRATRPREDCVNSPFIRAILIEGQRVDNCAFESRLRLDGPTLSRESVARLRKLELPAALNEWLPARAVLLLEISDKEPRAFDLYRGALRLGSAWVDEGTQLPRALAMAILKAQPAFKEVSHFQLETLADFVTLASLGNSRWRDRHGVAHDFAQDVRLATATPTFHEYCRSPYRSLAHDKSCRLNAAPDAQAPIWGLRPLLASALARTFARLTLAQKIRVMDAVRTGVTLPKVTSPAGAGVEELVDWFKKTLRAHAGALQMLTNANAEVAMRRSLDDLDVRSPTQWDVTIDLRHTPRWREIFGQLTARAAFRPRERALIFTPAGEVALPSGLPVGWDVRDVRSAKHVMIACHFPTPGARAGIRARQFFARQTCGTLATPFWE